MTTMRVKARGTGRLVSWTRLRRGELADRSRLSFSPTTVIPDVMADMITLCRRLADPIGIRMVSSNGFTRASFDLAIEGDGLRVACGRRLVRGGFPWNPLAAEFGANYDVLLEISADDPEIEDQLVRAVRDGYEPAPPRERRLDVR